MNIDSTQCKLLFNDPIQTESASILLRSRLLSCARRLGFSDAQRENLVLVASEMASNLVKHAGGKGMIQIWQQPDNIIDLFSFDYGPGVSNLALAQQDGYSTAHTLGKGLGSMQRLSDAFGMYTQQARMNGGHQWHGTAIWCRFYARKPESASMRKTAVPRYAIGLFCRSLSNDRFNGDHIYLHTQEEQLRLLHLDGLGHGEKAQLATDNLQQHLHASPDTEDVISAVDRHLRSVARGSVAICCDIDIPARTTRWIGVGDMGIHMFLGNTIQHFSFAPGVLGKEHKTPQKTEHKLEQPFTVISTSDGIRRGWDETHYPGLFNQHPQLIAYVLGNTMGRMADDQSLCAVTIN